MFSQAVLTGTNISIVKSSIVRRKNIEKCSPRRCSCPRWQMAECGTMVMVLLTVVSTEPSQEWNLIYWCDTGFLGTWGFRCSAPCLLCRHDCALSKTNIWNYKNVLRKSQSEHSCVLCFWAEGVWFLSGSGGLSWVQAPLVHAVWPGHASAPVAMVTLKKRQLCEI